MITLITGTPGQGKSVYAVWNEIRTAIEQGRTVYYNGIPKLTLPAIKLSDDEVLKWHETDTYKTIEGEELPVLRNLEEGALLVIDEAQRIFRPMGSGVAIPASLAYLEYHRHHGIDFVLLTQHPKLLHVNARALVGRHIHLRNGVLGRVSHEFGEWCENPQTKSARQSSIVRRNKLPTAAFALFESASIHVKPKKAFPVQIAVLGAVVLAVPAMGAFVYHNVKKTTDKPVIASAPVKQSDIKIASASMPSLSTPVAQSDKDKGPPPVYYVSDKYDWSKVAACITMRGEFACYDDAGVRLVMPPDVIKFAVMHGWPDRPVQTVSVPAESPTTRHEEEKSKPEQKPAVADLQTPQNVEPMNWETNVTNI